MFDTRRTWQQELEIIDRTMRAISLISDPDKLVEAYWTGISQLLPINDYVALSRRSVEAPYYIVTRSSRFTESLNPWTQRDRLPKLSGGILGDIAYANAPIVIDDLPTRLKPDDPGHRFLEGFESLFAMPQYDGGEPLNWLLGLFPPGKSMDHSKIPMMHWHAALFGRGTTNLVLRNHLAVALAELDRELHTVGQIQRSLLPRRLPQIDGFEVATHYLTSRSAGGDYYDFFPLKNDRWGVFIADVSGHGTPAAVIMAITHALAHSEPGAHAPPQALLSHLNQHLARSYTKDGTFVTAFYAILDTRARRLIYSAAGHNPPRVRRGDRILPLDQSASLPLGIECEQSYGHATLELQREDLLLLYTDGIIETPAPSLGVRPRQLFGLSRLDTLLLHCGAISAEKAIECVCGEVRAFSNNAPPNDDQTLIAIRCE